MHFPVPANEAERLAALLDLGLHDTTGSPEFDAIANLAADVFDCPMALITLLGAEEQWFKAKHGLDADVSPRELAFCNHTILSREPLIVSDARTDARFWDNPLVLSDPNVVFYAGAPIALDDAHNLGTLCVVDTKPREMSERDVQRLRNLAQAAEGLIAAYHSRRQAERAKKSEERKARELSKTASMLGQITKLSGVGGWELELETETLSWTSETKRIHEVPPEFEPKLETAIDFYAPEARPRIASAVEKAIETGASWDMELPMLTAHGKDIWVRAVGGPTYRDGKMVSLIGAFQDISERRRNDESIRASEHEAKALSEELRTILDAMDEGVSVFDADAKLVLWNQQYIDLFGKPEGEIRQGVPFRHLLECEKARGEFAEDIDAHLAYLFEQLRHGISDVGQFRTSAGTVIKTTHSPLPGGGWVGTHSDVTAVVLDAERARHAAHHDPLTGLPNRLAFNARLEAIRKADRGEDRALALLLVDLDKFKEVNDTLGHLAGDELLIGAAKRMRSCVRRDDLVARLGGDEFAIVIECAPDEAVPLAKTIAEAVGHEMRRPFEIGDASAKIGASIGVSVTPADTFEADDILARADSSLYEIKEGGRGSFKIHGEGGSRRERARRRKDAA